MLTAIIFLITIWFLFGCVLTYAIMTTLLTVEWIILIILGTLLIFSTLGWISYLLENYRPKLPKDKVILTEIEFLDNCELNYDIGYKKAIADLEKDEKVVLSREEYEKLTVPRYIIRTKKTNEEVLKQLESSTFCIVNNDSNIEIIPTRAEIEKETVEKFYDKVNENICIFKLKNKSLEFIDGYTQAIADICGRLDNAAKEFGVKIKE